MRHILLSVCAVFAVISTPALAQEAGWYLGADVGRAEVKSDFIPDLSDTAFGIHGGYRIARQFAVEAGYADLGNSSYTSDGCPPDRFCIPEAGADVELSGERWDLSLLGSVPLGESFEAYAKAGVARTETEVEARSLYSRSRSRGTDNSTDAIFGVGVRLHFDAPWSLRLQWDRTADVGDSNADIDGWWLGAEYRFAAN